MSSYISQKITFLGVVQVCCIVVRAPMALPESRNHREYMSVGLWHSRHTRIISLHARVGGNWASSESHSRDSHDANRVTAK